MDIVFKIIALSEKEQSKIFNEVSHENFKVAHVEQHTVYFICIHLRNIDMFKGISYDIIL
jgi:hypothetical protein